MVASTTQRLSSRLEERLFATLFADELNRRLDTILGLKPKPEACRTRKKRKSTGKKLAA